MHSRFAQVGADGIVERSLRFSSRTGPFALGLLLAFLVIGCASTEIGDPVCPDSTRWVERIEAVAAPGHKITGDEWELAEKIRTGGELTVDCLIPMLRARNPDFRAFVAYLLFEMKGLEPRHVGPILAAAMRDGVGSGLP